MKRKHVLDQIEHLLKPYRITDGKYFKLSDMDPSDTGSLTSAEKQEAKDLLASGVSWLSELQDVLYAQDKWGVLLIFQAMDAAGKDSTIKHVLSGVNPQGVQVYSFKQPSAEELDHDYMWRYSKCMPERGRIGIFNRSYYEEVLVARVHKEVVEKQKLPDQLMTKKIWENRLEDMAAYERYLARNGMATLKFFLNISKAEQTKRFLARLEIQQKNWKFSDADMKEREYWKDYMHAYEEAIRSTASVHAPWYVVPANNKWFARLIVAAATVELLENLDLAYPAVPKEKTTYLAEAKKALLAERDLGTCSE